MVAGFEIGHHTADGDGWLTGTTVVLARDGAVGGVDVRGGGPGTRETDLLDPSTLVERVRSREEEVTGGTKLTEAVARYYAKLLAYKDEYEVARLHADGAMERKISGMFEGDYRLVFHLSPPLLARRDPATGEPRKMRFGGWMLPVFRLLKSLRGVRGTPLDIFGYTEERRTERALIAEFRSGLDAMLTRLTPENHATITEWVDTWGSIRGFGHVKARNLEKARARLAEIAARLDAPASATAA